MIHGMKRIRYFYKVAATLGVCALHITQWPVTAATRTWVGLGGNGFWNTAANWSGSSLPAATNDLIFPSSSPQMGTVNNFLGAAHSITFGVGGYSITGNPLILTNGIIATNTTG